MNKRVPKCLKELAAEARAAKHHKSLEQTSDQQSPLAQLAICSNQLTQQSPMPSLEGAACDTSNYSTIYVDSSSESDCGYTGGVEHWNSSDSDELWQSSSKSEDDWDDADAELEEYDKEILEGLKAELAELKTPMPFDELSAKKTKKEWKDIEANQSLGYNGQSE